VQTRCAHLAQRRLFRVRKPYPKEWSGSPIRARVGRTRLAFQVLLHFINRRRIGRGSAVQALNALCYYSLA